MWWGRTRRKDNESRKTGEFITHYSYQSKERWLRMWRVDLKDTLGLLNQELRSSVWPICMWERRCNPCCSRMHASMVSVLSWRGLNTCLLMGSGEWVPCSALLVPTAFSLLIKLLLLNLWVFSLLFFWFSSPFHRGGGREWVSAVWCSVSVWG